MVLEISLLFRQS